MKTLYPEIEPFDTGRMKVSDIHEIHYERVGTPDGIPVISAVDPLPGLYLSTGFSGHGFGIGPGAGRLAADLIAGDPPIVDPYPYRYSRMIDGTDLGAPGMM